MTYLITFTSEIRTIIAYTIGIGLAILPNDALTNVHIILNLIRLKLGFVKIL